MTETISYSSRFQDPAAAAAYESREYGAGSYSTHVWRWQQPVLERLVGDFRRSRSAPVRLLDFAGRMMDHYGVGKGEAHSNKFRSWQLLCNGSGATSCLWCLRYIA